MDRGAWWASVHGVAESEMTEASEHTHIHMLTLGIHTNYEALYVYYVVWYTDTNLESEVWTYSIWIKFEVHFKRNFR